MVTMPLSRTNPISLKQAEWVSCTFVLTSNYMFNSIFHGDNLSMRNAVARVTAKRPTPGMDGSCTR